VIVAASTECFGNLPLPEALQRIVDLEFANVEISLRERPNFLRPTEVAANLEKAIGICRDTHRLNIAAYSLDIEAAGDEHYRQFSCICRLAKATKVVSVTVPSAEIGTPFNEEVEHLRKLVDIAAVEGVLVSIKSEVDRLSQDPGTVKVLCDNVKGLGLTLDPSAFVFGAKQPINYDPLMTYVYNVHLRDTKKDQLQVRVGQGEIEYGRLITQLRKSGYDRSVSACINEMPDVDHMGELRKMRLLLESLI
jgi:sugar phosphate isomerase/epimerase